MAGTITIASVERHGHHGRMVIDAAADGSGNSPAATVISGPGVENTSRLGSIKGLIQFIDTNPGSTAPADNYDITLTNDEGVDVLRGAGGNRDTANSERAPGGGTGVGDHGLMSPVFPTETLTLNVTNMTNNDSTTRIVLYWDESILHR